MTEQSERKPFRVYLWDICKGEKLPVWATLLGIIIGAAITAGSTYVIVPQINQRLERQKIRTDFIIKNLDDLNARTRVLVGEISELHFGILRSDSVDATTVQKSLTKIAEMQWKAVELGIIFENRSGGSVIKEYQKSLDDVRVALQNLKSKVDLPDSQKAIQRFSISTLNVVRELAGLGGLRLNDDVATPKS